MTDQLPWYSPQSLWASWKTWWPSILTILLALAATFLLFRWGYDDFVSYIEQSGESYTGQSRGEIVRNYGLLIAAFWAAVFAVWRGQIAKQQVERASRQTETALRQAETSERGLSDGRFQKGADMLGNQDFVTRMGGIYALEHLAKNHSDGYYRDQIIKLLATFVRSPVPDDELEKRIQEAIVQSNPGGRKFREDVWEAVRVISDLNSNEDKEHNGPDLSGSNLSNMRFVDLNLTRMNLIGVKFVNADLTSINLTGSSLFNANLTNADCIAANLTETSLFNATLTNVNFTGADLTDTLLNATHGTNMTRREFLTDPNRRGTDFTGVDLNGTNISGVSFSGATGLSQEQLDQACHAPDREPRTLPKGLFMDHEAAVARWEEWKP